MTNQHNVKRYYMQCSIFADTILVLIAVTSFLITSSFGEAIAQEEAAPATVAAGSVLKMSRASIPIEIPLGKGYENGNEIFFIATDASDKNLAAMVTNLTGFKVNYSPLLALTPESASGQAYVFKNGIEGKGPFGFQLPVLNAKPGDEGYSPLLRLNVVEWKQGTAANELKSVQEVTNAEKNGTITINKTGIFVNHPAVKWQGGELKVRENKTIDDDSPYGPAQVLNIDTEKMVVTMVAHRGWGPDGKSVYYVVTDATPEMPAGMMGVNYVPFDEKLVNTPVAFDLFQFMNGINGTGPIGFQAGIGAANTDDPNYSPMWKINFIEWKDPTKAQVLQTLDDILAMQKAGMITITPALDGKHVVNCPFFDQSTIIKHMSRTTGTV